MRSINDSTPIAGRTKLGQDQFDARARQILEEALSTKEKQFLAAQLGHSNVAIAPLEKQIRHLNELLGQQKHQDHDPNE